jgi:hypothetical protein
MSAGDADLTEHLARVLTAAFWETAREPLTWETQTPAQRDVFRLMAARTIEAARQFKQQRKAA